MTGQQGNPQPSSNVVTHWWSSVQQRSRAGKAEEAAAGSRPLPRMEVRRVRRVVRKIDPWTVLKTSLVFNTISGLVFVLGMWVTWSIAVQRGIPEGIASIFEALTLTFTPNGELYFRALLLLTIVLVVVGTAAMTLGAVIYNLISDMVGGVEFTVLEETFQPQSQTVLRRGVPPGRPSQTGSPTVPPRSTAPSGAGSTQDDALTR
ncbi:MAG: DUF3566 domain-containing protein [Acidimicrobiia bacterium]